MRVVAVYREDLLPVSECFVTEQTRHLERYHPFLVGTRRIPTAPAPDLPAVVLTDGPGLPQAARVAAYRLGGVGLRRRVAARRPSIVHAHFGPDAVQAMPLARRLAVPLVVTTHGYDVLTRPAALATSHRGRRYLAARPRLGREAALLLPVSDYLRGRMLEQGFPAEKVRTHYLGVDTQFFDPATVAAARPGTGALLFVGRLVPQKGVADLLHAVAECARTHPGVRLTVAGDGPQRADLERLAADLRVDARFVGSCSRETVRAHLAAADVLLSASHTHVDGWTEAFGLTTVEAQAMQVPVVAYAAGGLTEAVADGQTGLLVGEGDVRGLAVALTRLLDDPTTATAMGLRGRARTLRVFDLKRQTASLEGLYDEVLAQ